MDIVGKPSKFIKPIPYIKVNYSRNSITLSKSFASTLPVNKVGFAYDTDKIYFVALPDGLCFTSSTRTVKSVYHVQRIKSVLGEQNDTFYVNSEEGIDIGEGLKGILLRPLSKELRTQLVNESFDSSPGWL